MSHPGCDHNCSHDLGGCGTGCLADLLTLAVDLLWLGLLLFLAAACIASLFS